MFFRFLFVFDLLFNSFRIALWPSVGKELFPWRFICAVFILVSLSLSRLVFRAGYGIRLYRFLISTLFRNAMGFTEVNWKMLLYAFSNTCIAKICRAQEV